ncbi:MAG: dimethylsulfoniopropionate demethylase [Candidatus Puniceispirillaceae bacterium]
MSGAPIFPSRRLRPTPFSERVAQSGVSGYTVYNHMLLPSVFSSLEDDYHHLKKYAQIWDVAVERQVQLKGPDAHKLAVMISARDLSNAEPGRCYYTPVVDGKGGMLNDPVALCIAPDTFWFSIADSDLLLWAAGLAEGLGLNVEVTEPDVSPLAIQGPMAEDLLAKVFGEEVRSIKFFRFKWFEFKGLTMAIARSGWSKQGGFEIYLPDSALGNDLWDAITAKGEAFNLRAGCPNLIERIEGGLFSYGNDMTRGETPLEMGLEKYCSLDNDHSYIGKEALLRQRDAGLKRRIRGLKMDGAKVKPLTMPWQIEESGHNVGFVTSAAFSPDMNQNIAFAMLNTEVAQTGQELTITSTVGTHKGVVCDIPFEI